MAVKSNLFGSNLIDYNVSLDITSLNGSDSSGSTGSLSVTGLQRDLDIPSEMLRNKTLQITEPAPISGRVSVVTENSVSKSSSGNEVISVTGETLLFRFNADVTIPPIQTTATQAILHIGSRVGLTASDFNFQLSSNPTVSVPGYLGNAWVFLKNLLSLHKMQVTVEGTRIVVRSARGFDTLPVDPFDLMNGSFSVQDQQIARRVEIKYYNHRPVTRGLVYPIEENSDAQIFQLSPGERIETEIKLDSWLSSVNQPVPVDYVDANSDFSGTNGVYCVAGADGLGVRAVDWVDNGGYLAVKITDDPSVLSLTIQAPTASALSDRQAPYSIAATSGNLYNSLRITGSGTKFNEKSFITDTGSSNAVVGAEVGVTVDNPFVSTLSDAFNIGLTVAQSYAGPEYIRNASQAPGRRKEFSEPLGERYRIKDAVFRTYTVSESPTSSDISARMDTTVKDFNGAWAGKTVANFNSEWTEVFTLSDFAVAPLRRTSE